jgi:hypothetical protein
VVLMLLSPDLGGRLWRRSILLLLGVALAWIYATELGLLDPLPQAPPSRSARADIPGRYLGLYQQAARHHCPGLPWTILAGVGKVESDHGRARLPGVRAGWNRAGAAGPMQFGIGVGRAGNAWAGFGRDFGHDGRRSVYDPGDAIPAAANYLCGHGAPRHLDRAIYAYNHSWGYVATVKQFARRYAARGGGRR